MNRSKRLRTVGAVLTVAFVVMACSSTTDSGSTTQPSAPPDPVLDTSSADPPEPLLDIHSGMTWQQMIDEIADEDELACIDGLLGDELPEDLLDITVTEPVGWPIVTTELIGIEIGDDQWPHELWRCMSAETAAAVYLSVFAQEEHLARDFDIDAQSAACLSALPGASDFANTAAQVLGSEASFSDGEPFAGFLESLDEVAASLAFPCIPAIAEYALGQGLGEALGNTLTEDELACLTDAAVDEARRSGVDLGKLSSGRLSDAEFDRQFESLVMPALQACGLADASSAPDDAGEKALSAQAATEIVRIGLGPLLGADEFDCAAEVIVSEAIVVDVDLTRFEAGDWAYEGPLAKLMLTALAACHSDNGTSSMNTDFPIAVTGDEIYVVTQHGDALSFVQLTDDGGWHSSASWSPDGLRLVYSSDVDGDSEIYIVNADGSGHRQLTQDAFSDIHPSWSPAGNRIAFQSDRSENGRFELFTMSADGSDIVPITSGLYNFDGYSPVSASWSPDGTRIAFGVGSGILSMAADGSDRLRINQGEALREAAWSPDGTRIAYAAYAESGEGIWLVNADGSNPQQVTAGPHSYPAWSPDGTRLAFVDDEQHVLISNADGSDIRRLGTEPLGRWPTWSPIPYAEQGLALVLRHTFAGDLSDQQLDCVTDTALERFRADGLAVGALLHEGLSDVDYIDRLDLLVQLVTWPALDACVTTGN